MLRLVRLLVVLAVFLAILPKSVLAQENVCPGLMMAYNQPGPLRQLADIFEIARARCDGSLHALHKGDEFKWKFVKDDPWRFFEITQVYTDSVKFNGGSMGFLHAGPIVAQVGKENRAMFYPLEMSVAMQTIAVFVPRGDQNGIGWDYFATGLDRVEGLSRTRLVKLAEGGTGNRLQYMEPEQCIGTRLSDGTVGFVQLKKILSAGYALFDSGGAGIGRPVIASNAQYHSEIVGYVIAMRYTTDPFGKDQNAVVLVMTTEGITGDCNGK